VENAALFARLTTKVGLFTGVRDIDTLELKPNVLWE